MYKSRSCKVFLYNSGRKMDVDNKSYKVALESAILEQADASINIFKQISTLKYGEKWDIGRNAPHKQTLTNNLWRLLENLFTQTEGKKQTLQHIKMEISKADKILQELRKLLYAQYPDYGKVRVLDEEAKKYVTRIDKLLKYLKLAETTILNLKGAYINEAPDIRKMIDSKVDKLSKSIANIIENFQKTYDRLLMTTSDDDSERSDNIKSESPGTV